MDNIKELMQTLPEYNCDNLKIPGELKQNAKNLCYRYSCQQNTEEESKEILKQLFGTSSEMMVISPGFRCDYGFNIHIHGLAVINYNCVILDTSPVHLGENIFIGPNVCISCAGHSLDAVQRANAICTSRSIHIGKNVWIGANSVICGGVTIGDNSVIGAGSVVTKDIPSGVVAVGSSCKAIREITEDDVIKPEDLLQL